MDLLPHLRQATQKLHQSTEEYSNASKIIDHSISEEEYKALLKKNYIAYKLVECAIKNERPHPLLDKLKHNPEISTWIAQDLNGKLPQLESYFIQFDNALEAIGGTYVITGSLLGGALLGKHLIDCPNISTIEHNFYSTKDRSRIGRWQLFKKEVSSYSFTSAEQEVITKGANKSFRLFLDVFKKEKFLM
tara:strand:+ start:2903 stop:3472 length:570 start_codon:yes stop_codon:yes gene_type:complete